DARDSASQRRNGVDTGGVRNLRAAVPRPPFLQFPAAAETRGHSRLRPRAGRRLRTPCPPRRARLVGTLDSPEDCHAIGTSQTKAARLCPNGAVAVYSAAFMPFVRGRWRNSHSIAAAFQATQPAESRLRAILPALQLAAMTTFFFRAVASDGKVRTGRLTGDTDKFVARELRKQGLTPVYVGVAPKKSYELKLPAFASGRRRDVLFFTQELSTLLNAGVPLDRALAITAELTERPSFRAIVLDVLRVLKGGKPLADSLATHGEYFSDLFVNMVRAGEASGALAVVFERLSEFERSRDELRNYIVSAMIYPALLCLVGLASVIILLTFVVPPFASLFDDSHMQMPLAVASAVPGLRLYIGTLKGRLRWDGWRLKLALWGDALRKAETSRFARAMATLLANTVPLVQAIGISGGILNNRYIARGLDAVSQGVKRGEGIAAPITKVGVFPPLVGHLLTVGEETGRLDSMFTRMADIYEEDTRAAIKRFTAVFEPIVILVMGVIVGGFILSILVAITSINDVAI